MLTRRFCWLLLLVVFLRPYSVSGQAPTGKHTITIDDYFTQADLFGIAYSTKYIAYTEGRWQESTDDRKTDLWVVPTAGGKSRRLTSELLEAACASYFVDEQESPAVYA